MLEKAFSTKNAKNFVAETFSLKKKTITGVSINNNNGAGKIFGQLVSQKQVCDQKRLQKLVCD